MRMEHVMEERSVWMKKKTPLNALMLELSPNIPKNKSMILCGRENNMENTMSNLYKSFKNSSSVEENISLHSIWEMKQF